MAQKLGAARKYPKNLPVVSKNDDGYEAIKLVMSDDYELLEDEYYLDYMEDTCGEDEDSEYGVVNDDDDENNEEREEENKEEPEEEIETDQDDKMEDDAENMQALINNERRDELAALEEQIIDHNEQITRASMPEGMMTLNMPSIMTMYMLIHQADERCRELGRQIADSRES